MTNSANTTPLDMPRNSLPPFLQKLRTITQSVPPEIASWSENGKSFVVHKSSFTDILKQYFKGNLQTFVRQLHFYGFRKLDAAGGQGGQWSFAHKSFLRDYPHLLYEIKRKSRLEPDANSASQAEVQALRTQVAYLQDVVEDLRSQLDAVMAAVDNTEQQETKQSAKPGAKRLRTGDAVFPVSEAKGETISCTENKQQKKPAEPVKASLPSHVKLEDPLFSSEQVEMAQSDDVVTKALRDEEVVLDIGDMAIEPVNLEDARSLGELSEEDWLDVMSTSRNGLADVSMMPGSPNSNSSGSMSDLPLAEETPDDATPSAMQRIHAPSKEFLNALPKDSLKVTDEATKMVAEATQLDSGAVSKVLAYLREAAVNLATGGLHAKSNPLPNNRFTRTVSSAGITSKSSVVKRPTTPAPLGPSSVGETVNRKPLSRSTSAPPCSTEVEKVGISEADQCAVLLPLLLHIPQVQSALSEYKKFGVVGVEQLLRA